MEGFRMNKNLEALEKQFGSIDFEGKKYFLTEIAYVNNYGTNGEVRYYADAIDAEGKEYRITWETSEEYDKACELMHLETSLTDFRGCLDEGEELRKKEIEERIAELEAEDVRSFYCEDESNACDWDYPMSVEERYD